MVKLGIASSYDPFEDPRYMSQQMLNYFKNKLIRMHQEILQKESPISFSLVDTPTREPDYVDQGSNEELHIEGFLFQEHEDQLRQEIELAIKRINEGTYGYCEETGDPIGVRRLLAVPYARFCLKVQQDKEHEKQKITVGL